MKGLEDVLSFNYIVLMPLSEAYLEPYQSPKVVYFANIVNGFSRYFRKMFHLRSFTMFWIRLCLLLLYKLHQNTPFHLVCIYLYKYWRRECCSLSSCFFLHNMHRCIQSPVKCLRWNVLQKYLTTTTFEKRTIIDVWQDSKYTSGT